VGDGATDAALTINAGTSTIKLQNSAAGAKYFEGAGKTYYNLWLAPGSGTGTFNITGSNTFNMLKDDGSAAHSVLFSAGTTQTISDWQIVGSASGLITVGSASAATHTLVKSGGGVVNTDYLSLSYSTASPALTWYAGLNSTNAGNNSNWSFFRSPFSMSATVASYTITTGSAGLRADRYMQAVSQSLSIGTIDATFRCNRVLIAQPASIYIAAKSAAPSIINPQLYGLHPLYEVLRRNTVHVILPPSQSPLPVGNLVPLSQVLRS